MICRSELLGLDKKNAYYLQGMWGNLSKITFSISKKFILNNSRTGMKIVPVGFGEVEQE